MTKGMSFGKQIGIALLVITGIAGIVFFTFGDLAMFALNPFENVTQLSISDAVPIDCDVYNLLELQFADGSKRIAYTGIDGYIPNVQSLSIVDRTTGNEIEEIHIQLALACAGSLMRTSSSITVSGHNHQSLCTYLDSATKECLTISGSSFTGKQATISKPFTYQDGLVQTPIPTTSITDRERVVIWQGTLTTADVIRLYGDPPKDTGLSSTMFPHIILQFSPSGQRLGIDALAENDRTTTNWSGWTYVAPPVDTDGDGFDDSVDECPELPETFNGFRDDDGCPDEILDQDADGIDDDRDFCPDTPLGDSVTTTGSSIGCSNQQIDALNDTDGDGVLNQFDLCENTIPNVPVDDDGCQLPIIDRLCDFDPTDPSCIDPIECEQDQIALDRNNDGVIDTCLDTDVDCNIDPTNSACPSDDACLNPNEQFCIDGVNCGMIMNAQDPACLLDSDGDGLFDFQDQCPDLFGEIIFQGCPQPCPQGVSPNPDGTCPDDIFDGLTDSDGDGVNDAEDICPNTEPNTDVDANGCELSTGLDIIGDFFADDIVPLFDPFAQPTEPKPQPIQTTGSSTPTPFSIADNVTLIILLSIIALIAVVVIAKIAKKF